jgi:hypothetical protein
MVGCSAVGVTDQSGGGAEPGIGIEDPGAPDYGTGGGKDGDDSGGPSREVIVTGSLYLTVTQPLVAADEATRIVERRGGRVDARQEFAPRQSTGNDDSVSYSPDGYPVSHWGGFPGRSGGAILELRIPSDGLTATIEELEELGTLEELRLSSDDVTVEVRDLDARILALRSSVERLLALQTTAADIDDLIALETAISDRQAELESMEALQRYYADQVSLATLVLTLGSEDVAPPAEPDTFWSGLEVGWDALLGFLSASLVVAGVLLPWLLPLTLLVLLVWAIVRRLRRRRARVTEGAPPGPQ